MAAINIIEQLGCGGRILELWGQGYSSGGITEALKEEYGDKAPSQRTVSRHLKDLRMERREESKKIAQDYIRPDIPQDLETLKHIISNLLTIFNNYEPMPASIRYELQSLLYHDFHEQADHILALFDKACAAAETRKIGFDIKTVMAAGRDLTSVITTKLRFAGILEGDDAVSDGTASLRALLSEIDGEGSKIISDPGGQA